MVELQAYLPVILGVVGVIVVLSAIMSMWKKIPQDKAGVVTGLRKRVISGGGTLIIPILERMDIISLENTPLNINTTGAMTIQGVPITAAGVAVIKVKNDKDSILSAMEQFYTGSEPSTIQRVKDTVSNVLEGKLREIVGKMTVEEIYKDREAFSQQVRDVADSSLAAMGFELIAFTIKEITDANGYLEALGAPRIAAVKKDAAIAKAEADRDAKVKIAEANKQGEEARLRSEAEIAEAEKNKEVKQSLYLKESQTAKADADAAYEIQQNIMKKNIIDTNADAEMLRQQRDQGIAAEQMEVEVAKERKNIELAQTKADAKKRELEETVINPAEASRREAELRAEAGKIRAIKEAEAAAEARKLDAQAQAEAKKMSAAAEAEAKKLEAAAQAYQIEAIGLKEAGIIKAKGEAEAEAVRLKLEAEAAGMRKKAEAYAQYGEAAVIQMIIEVLPEMARNVAEPIRGIDKMVVWDSGTDGGKGVMRIPETVTRTLAATMDAMNEMTGFDVKAVLDKFTKDGGAAEWGK
ncbi:MAG: flotillin family protein [Clostridiales bacterium]|jgi:flotillin|nr:flotillin family protein [Clostridiales bacterium]